MNYDRRRLMGAAALLPFAAWAQDGAGDSRKTGKRLLILDFEIVDTSNEPVDQRAEHARRLAAARDAIAAGLASRGTYQIVDRAAIQSDLDQIERQTYIRNCNCVSELGRKAGAELVMTGLVNKVSTLILSMGVSITRASSGELIYHQGFDFRGDNDQSYARAAKFFTERIARDPAS